MCVHPYMHTPYIVPKKKKPARGKKKKGGKSSSQNKTAVIGKLLSRVSFDYFVTLLC